MTNTRRFYAIMAFVLVSALAVCALSFGTTKAYAAGTNFANAEKVALNKWKTDTYSYEMKGEMPHHYYQFKTSTDKYCTYSIQSEWLDTFVTPSSYSATGTGVRYHVYDGDHNHLPGYFHIAKGNDASYNWELSLKPNKTYFIEIMQTDGTSWNHGATIQTRFKVKQVVTKPTQPIVKAKVGKKQVKATWTCSRATKYEVKLKVNGGTWKNYNVKTKSKIFKKLKAGKTYYVKVRGVRTVDGKDYKGAWSKAVKSAKVK